MIPIEQARKIASEKLGIPATDTEHPWHLQQFNNGYLVVRDGAQDKDLVGSSNFVVEASGRLLEFPSSVPPKRITEEYDDIVKLGYPR